ncbi:MAG: MFS transporter, partial [Acidobacteria bacterium]|nr:MFS transporter [Acidobacteriota bacterium]NIQ83505.1 MFS transporter [Acidobacteriota bacterium]
SLSAIAGNVADRYDQKRVMLATQIVIALFSLALALLILYDAIDVWGLIAWAVTVGALTAFAVPTQAAMVPRLVDSASLPSA